MTNLKPWSGICSKSCWEATEKRCRCRCMGLYHGGANVKRLDDFLAREEVRKVDEAYDGCRDPRQNLYGPEKVLSKA